MRVGLILRPFLRDGLPPRNPNILLKDVPTSSAPLSVAFSALAFSVSFSVLAFSVSFSASFSALAFSALLFPTPNSLKISKRAEPVSDDGCLAFAGLIIGSPGEIGLITTLGSRVDATGVTVEDCVIVGAAAFPVIAVISFVHSPVVAFENNIFPLLVTCAIHPGGIGSPGTFIIGGSAGRGPVNKKWADGGPEARGGGGPEAKCVPRLEI